jgi:hypothetical protein
MHLRTLAALWGSVVLFYKACRGDTRVATALGIIIGLIVELHLKVSTVTFPSTRHVNFGFSYNIFKRRRNEKCEAFTTKVKASRVRSEDACKNSSQHHTEEENSLRSGLIEDILGATDGCGRSERIY